MVFAGALETGRAGQLEIAENTLELRCERAMDEPRAVEDRWVRAGWEQRLFRDLLVQLATTRFEAAIAAVLAKSGTESICVKDVLGIRTRVVSQEDGNPVYNDTDHCVQLVGFENATGRSETHGHQMNL